MVLWLSALFPILLSKYLHDNIQFVLFSIHVYSKKNPYVFRPNKGSSYNAP